MILLIPFTYSIICGVGFGYALYISIGISTGTLYKKFTLMYNNIDDTRVVSQDLSQYDDIPVASINSPKRPLVESEIHTSNDDYDDNYHRNNTKDAYKSWSRTRTGSICELNSRLNIVFDP